MESSGTNTLLAGPPGSGKTTSLVTAILAGLDLAVIVIDPNGEESLLDAAKMYGVDMSHLHYKYVPPAKTDWKALADMAKKINWLSYEDLTKLKSGIAKQEHHQFLDVIETCSNFVCDHCGLVIGPVDALDSTWMLAVDSLSSLNIMALELIVGGKPAAHMGEWGVAMSAEEKLIMKWCSDMRCFFVLTAHVEREFDEAVGTTKLMAGALGRKLAPKLPRYFSDFVYSYVEAGNFFWSTNNSQMDLKARTLLIDSKLKPSFVQIVDHWKARAAAAPSVEPEAISDRAPASIEPPKQETTTP